MSMPRAVCSLALALCTAFALAVATGCGGAGDDGGGGTGEDKGPHADPFVLSEMPETDFTLTPSDANTFVFEDDEQFVVRGRVLDGAGAFYTATLIDLDVDLSHTECTSEGCTMAHCAIGGPTVLSASIPVRFVKQGTQDAVRVDVKPAYLEGDIVEVVGTIHLIDRESSGGSVDRVFYATGYRVLDEDWVDTEPNIFGNPDIEDPFVRVELPQIDEEYHLTPSEACIYIYEDDKQYFVRGYVHQGARAFHSAQLIDFWVCEECGICTGADCDDAMCSLDGCSTDGCGTAGCAPGGTAVSPSSILTVYFVHQDSHEPIRLEARPHYREGDIIEVTGIFTEEEVADGFWQRSFLATSYRVVPKEELEAVHRD